MNRILILTEHRENRRLLAETLAPHYEIIEASSENAIAGNFDLCIVDGITLDRLGPQLEAKKQAESPIFLPILFISSRKDVGMMTRFLWKSIDELIFTPIQRIELLARVRNLYEKRRLSIEYNRFILQTTTNAILILDSNGRVLQWNPSAEAIFGWSESEIIGKTPPFIPNENDEVFRQMLNEVKEGKDFSTITRNYLRKDKTTVDLHIASSPLHDADGAVNRIVFVAADLTLSRKVMELQQRRLRELEAINHITSVLRQANTVEEALPILLNETLSVLDFPAGCIWLYDSTENMLRRVAASGWFADLDEMPIRPGEGIAGTVFARNQSYISREFASNGKVDPAISEQIPPGWGGACIPILAENKVVGVFFVSCQLPREIQTEEVTLLESLARIAGITLHRMRLHETIIRRARELQALHEIDRAISGTMGLNIILDTVCQQTIAQLHVDAVGVLLFNPNSLDLHYAAGQGFRSRAYQHLPVRLGDGLTGMAALERKMIFYPDIRSAIPKFTREKLIEEEGFTSYAAVPLISKGNLKGMLEVFHRSPLNFNPEDWDFLEKLALQCTIGIENAQSIIDLKHSKRDLELAYDKIIEGLAQVLELSNKESKGHTRRVTDLTVQMARVAGIAEAKLVNIQRGALLHDIGKMAIPDKILHKPGKLTDKEWGIIRQHPQYAYDILSPNVYLGQALDIPYYHHEKWDGSGYPMGLKGDEIPLAARLFTVVDVWDALLSARPYRPAWPKDKVFEYIQSQASVHFDPQAVNIFFQVLREMERSG